MSNPYSAGGGGTQLETRVAASCIAAVLFEAPVRGLPGDFATAVQSQRSAFDHPLDDIIVKGVRADGREVQLDLQVKNKLSFTENDAEWVDVLQRAWDTFAKGTSSISFGPFSASQRVACGREAITVPPSAPPIQEADGGRTRCTVHKQ
jgi:hypothetical protein